MLTPKPVLAAQSGSRESCGTWMAGPHFVAKCRDRHGSIAPLPLLAERPSSLPPRAVWVGCQGVLRLKILEDPLTAALPAHA